MTKEQYLSDLASNLGSLPEKEKREALLYYEEYFAESPLSEEETSSQLGSPSKAARSILAQESASQIDINTSPVKKGTSGVRTILLLVLAAPIGLPLAIALAALLLAVFITIGAILLSVFLAAAALAIAGVVSVIVSVMILFTDVTTSLFTFGFGMAILGGGILFGMGAVWLVRRISTSIANYAKRRADARKEKL